MTSQEHSALGKKIRKPLRLRARVIAYFVAGACVLSAILSLSTYVVVRHTLVQQRESLAERQTFVNAKLVRSGLRLRNPDIGALLDSLENPTGSESILRLDQRWYFSEPLRDAESIPSEFSEMVVAGTPAVMKFEDKKSTQLIVGVPIPSVDAVYFEISSLREIEDTMRLVAWSLLIASIFTCAGGAALGLWASRIVLRPVIEASLAAESIAGGDLDTRLVPEGDKDLDRLVRSFNRMVDALQARVARDARFASDVSHELRSPLMTLASGISVLQSRRSELPQRSQTALDLLADEVQRFQRMVQDLLEISRTDAGRVDVSFEEVLAVEFAERVTDRYERHIPVNASADITEAILRLDKRRMERVLGNIIENADRYAGGVISIGVERHGAMIRYVIDDEGPGVPEAERERIFERFARGTSARARASGEGTGLGLSLVREHVHLHGGSVWAEARPGGGSRFVIELPEAEL